MREKKLGTDDELNTLNLKTPHHVGDNLKMCES